jgi:predicted site-specific integrase-resolvase
MTRRRKPNVPELLSAKQIAEAYPDVPRSTVYRWSRTGVLRPIRRVGKLYFRRADVERLLGDLLRERRAA